MVVHHHHQDRQDLSQEEAKADRRQGRAQEDPTDDQHASPKFQLVQSVAAVAVVEPVAVMVEGVVLSMHRLHFVAVRLRGAV